MNLGDGFTNHSLVLLSYKAGATLEAMGTNQRILERHHGNPPPPSAYSVSPLGRLLAWVFGLKEYLEKET